MAAPLAQNVRQMRGAAAKRGAIWICLVGLPAAYEASNLLSGPRTYYQGDRYAWFSGLDVRLALTAIGLAAVLWALRRSGEGLVSIGWPKRLRWWEWALCGLVLVGGVVAVFYHPPSVSVLELHVPVSTPITLLERAWLLPLAMAEAVVQELVWRGAMITWLEPSVGTGGAVLLSGLSYLFFHPVLGLTWGTLRLALPLVALYTLLFLRRRSVGPSAFIHYLLTAGQLLSPV